MERLEPVQEVDVFNPSSLQDQTITDALNLDIESLRKEIGLKDQEAASTFDKSLKKYSDRLRPYFSESTRPTAYDLASDIGAAMLSADPTAGAFRSAGIGFSNFNERLKKDKENRIALDRQVGLKAMEMAITDERAAADYLNKLELERIKNSTKPYSPLIYEVTDPETQETTIIEVDPRNPAEVAAIRALPNARQIKSPDSQINIDSRATPQTERDKQAGKTLDALQKQWSEDAKAGISQNQLTNQFMLQLSRLGEKGWGRVQAATMGTRQFLDEFGLRSDPSLSDQQLVATLGTRIAMSLVGQTKGAITEMEMRLFLAASPTLASTFDGAKKQAAFLQRIANLNIKKAEDYNISVASGLLDSAKTDADALRIARGWEIQWLKKNKFLTAEEMAELRTLAAKEPEIAKAFREDFLDDGMSGEPDSLDTDLSNIELTPKAASGS